MQKEDRLRRGVAGQVKGGKAGFDLELERAADDFLKATRSRAKAKEELKEAGLARTGTQLTSRYSAPQLTGEIRGRPRKDGKEPFRLKNVVEVLEEYGLDPLAEIATILKEQPDALKPNERVRVLESLLEYYTPKLKAVEHKGEVDVRQRLSDEQIKAIAAEVLAK